MTQFKSIKDIGYLKKLIHEGYVVKGNRNNFEQDLALFEKFLDKGHEFYTEEYLINDGYMLIPPSTFTKNFTLLYKEINDMPVQYYRTNYSLKKGEEKEVFLYLKKKDAV